MTRLALDSRLHNSKQRFGLLQLVSATRPTKVPIAPMGKWLTCLPYSRFHNYKLSGQLQSVRAAKTLKLPSPVGKMPY
jgi:hypothetical protein